MAKIALYQKYRSSDFDEVVGQEYIVRSIRNAVRENKVGHAYLFCGPRGTGKTTMARLLAKAVNCENKSEAPCGQCENCKAANAGSHPDIVEINGANETKVENIRELIEHSAFSPMQGKHKIYIIDEVHQLSSSASSALLKTLEEPPAHVIFILATTDPQKLLPTIISRCQRYDFTKVAGNQITNHLLSIAEKENIKMEPEAAEMIAVLSDGGMRDALSIMDQCASYTGDHITMEDINQIYGLTTAAEKIDLIKDIVNKNLASLITRIRAYEEKGIDLSRFLDGMIDILKDEVIYRNTNQAQLLKVLNEEQAKDLSDHISSSFSMTIAEKLIDAKQRFRIASNAATAFEVTCLALACEDQTVQKETEAAVKKPVKKKTEEPVVMIKNDEIVPEIKKEVIPEKKEPEVIAEQSVQSAPDENMILSILVQCDKQSKAADENTMAMMSSYASLENIKYTSILSKLTVAASGNDCILLKSDQNVYVDRVNDSKMNEELYFFMKNVMNTDKMLFAISEDAFRSATKQFIERRKSGNLPEALVIKKYQKTETEEDSVEQKVINLFGKENVEIL